MKLFAVVAIVLSLAYGTDGQEPSRETTASPITERRIVWEEWNTLSECRTSPENYMCSGQRTGVSVAIALNTGICTATVAYTNCLETRCPSTPDLRESIARISDRCQGSKVKSTQVPTSTTRATPSPTTGVPTSTIRRNTQVYAKSVISETDLVDNEWSTLTTCRFLDSEDVCDITKKTLQSSLIIEFGVCGSALAYINCLETNCHNSSDLDSSILRIRNRCIVGQTTEEQDTTTQTSATTTTSTPEPTTPTTLKTTTLSPETDVVIAEWNTLISCHPVDDKKTETCDGFKLKVQHAVLTEYEVCETVIDYVECLEDVCTPTYSLTNSISRIRSRCIDEEQEDDYSIRRGVIERKSMGLAPQL